MIDSSLALAAIPDGLRVPLLSEYQSIVQNYTERRWSPSELSGGLFCEIVYTILVGYTSGTYARGPSKPANFVAACRSLESNASVPRSFQILIPRILPALYEIRNNRGVGHAGGDVDPNHMDAAAVLSISSWVMAELVRVFHSVSADEAKELVDRLVERRIPLVWQESDMRRVLDPNLPAAAQVLVLLASSNSKTAVSDLARWTDTKPKKFGYFLRLLRKLHAERKLELSADETSVQILPPGSQLAEATVAELAHVS